ncbi:cupin domain-containing protein [Paratractidigestivibacter sp.]|uniref:cupin domain-containing protein n=1 Tax=Paratractidigestivibacter sp. TaxID=2847316 RepID=UPI002ABE43BA|nr:cupin domain-containing protein [Paratractidigestivibacter sp.]
MPFRNLPTEAAAPLASLIDARPGQVSSMALTRLGDPIGATLLAFSEGESVSEERYPGDTLYYLVEGAAQIRFADHSVAMTTGDVLRVPADVEHAVEPTCATKLLQICFV